MPNIQYVSTVFFVQHSSFSFLLLKNLLPIWINIFFVNGSGIWIGDGKESKTCNFLFKLTNHPSTPSMFNVLIFFLILRLFSMTDLYVSNSVVFCLFVYNVKNRMDSCASFFSQKNIHSNNKYDEMCVCIYSVRMNFKQNSNQTWIFCFVFRCLPLV